MKQQQHSPRNNDAWASDTRLRPASPLPSFFVVNSCLVLSFHKFRIRIPSRLLMLLLSPALAAVSRHKWKFGATSISSTFSSSRPAISNCDSSLLSFLQKFLNLLANLFICLTKMLSSEACKYMETYSLRKLLFNWNVRLLSTSFLCCYYHFPYRFHTPSKRRATGCSFLLIPRSFTVTGAADNGLPVLTLPFFASRLQINSNFIVRTIKLAFRCSFYFLHNIFEKLTDTCSFLRTDFVLFWWDKLLSLSFAAVTGNKFVLSFFASLSTSFSLSSNLKGSSLFVLCSLLVAVPSPISCNQYHVYRLLRGFMNTTA